MTSLVIAEHEHGSLKGATLNTVAAAQQCGGDVHVLVAGHNAAEAAIPGFPPRRVGRPRPPARAPPPIEVSIPRPRATSVRDEGRDPCRDRPDSTLAGDAFPAAFSASESRRPPASP